MTSVVDDAEYFAIRIARMTAKEDTEDPLQFRIAEAVKELTAKHPRNGVTNLVAALAVHLLGALEACAIFSGASLEQVMDVMEVNRVDRTENAKEESAKDLAALRARLFGGEES